MKGARIVSLKETMVETIKALNKVVHYNIVDFGGVISVMYEGDLTDDFKMGLERVSEMSMSGQTRSYDAMEVGALIPDVDTLIFLSDGVPTGHSLIHQWEAIRSALRVQLRYYPIAIYAIDFAAGKSNLEHMKAMSEENHGQFDTIFIDPDEDKALKQVKKKKGKK